MGNLPEKLGRILEMLDGTSDRQERIELLISLADRFVEVPPEIAARPFPPEHRTPHCESEVYAWVVRGNDNRFALHFAVENPQGISSKAFAAILQMSLNGATLEEIKALPNDLALRVFGNELSMGKNLGLTSLVSLVQSMAADQA